MNNDNNVSLAITPDSDIYLLKVPFEIDNTNQLTFANVEAQTTYFMGLNKLYLEDATYLRKEGILRYPANFDDIVTYNYCMYRNTAFSNKWYYAYIDDIRFENPNMSTIKLRTDVFQTWQFDIVYKKMFVEREHVNNDTIGLHTIPENLEMGEYVMNSVSDNTQLSDIVPVICMGYNPVVEIDGHGYYYANVYQGYGFYIVKTALSDQYFNPASQVSAISDLIYYLANLQKVDTILAIFMAPRYLAGYTEPELAVEWTQRGSNGHQFKIAYAMPFIEWHSAQDPIPLNDWTTTKATTLNGYTPKNKKLLTWPYSFLNVNNNSGTVITYRYEDFSTSGITFKVTGCLTPGCSIKAYPTNYKGVTNNYSEGINAGKYPISSWQSDVYTNWLTQQSANFAIDTATNVAKIIGGAIAIGGTGGVGGIIGGGTILSGVTGIADTLESVYEHSKVPQPTEGNINSGDINAGNLKSTLTFEKMSIKQEYAKIIDDYFSAFGYKVNEYKIPNITGRTNWNYVKTIGCNILGDIPQRDIQELKGIFNNGVTFWHNPTTFLDYSQTNSIVS